MRRWFRALLRLFPSDFRGDFGEEMEEVFDGELENAGRGRRATVLRRNAGAMLRTGPRLHLEQMRQDVWYAVRALRHSPVFTVVAGSALAFGIGAAVVTFSLADAYLFKPLPYRQPDRLVHVWASDWSRGFGELRASYPEFDAWSARPDIFSGAALFNYTSVELTGTDLPERIAAGSVSANLFDVLGVAPLLGRTFRAGDDRPGAAPVAMVSERFWRTRLRSAAIDGMGIEIGGQRHEVVGVAPDGFNFPLPITRIWVPRVIDPARHTADVRQFQIVARLGDGVSPAQAASALDGVSADLATQYPTLDGRAANVVPLRRALNFAYDMLVIGGLVMSVATLLVLLAACANISSLMLGRTVRRGREVAIRAAIGASRFRLIRQFMVESLVLAGLGAAAGLMLAHWTIALLTQVIPDELYRAAPFAIDWRSVLVGGVLAVFAALVFGFAPALRFARVNLGDAMRQDGGGGTTSRRSLRLQSHLVAAQVALSVVLLVGTVLAGRSFSALGAVDPGFDAGPVLTLQVVLPSERYADADALARFHEDVIARVQVVPGVRAASTVNYLPLNNEWQPTPFSVTPPPSDGPPLPEGSRLSVGPGYFDTLGISVLTGRTIQPSDRRGQPPVAVVSERLAARHWPDESPLGQDLWLGGFADPFSVIGVVDETRQVDLGDDVLPQIYLAQGQQPWSYLRVLARTEGAPSIYVETISAAIHDVDPLLPIVEARPLDGVIDQFLQPQRALSTSLLVVGGFSLWLALFGIYGIVTCFVVDRTRELGVRVALGADGRRIAGYVLARALRLAGWGSAIGVVIAIAGGRAVRGMLFGVEATDPLTYLLVVALVAGVASLAGLLPARRAARISPLTAMKTG